MHDACDVLIELGLSSLRELGIDSLTERIQILQHILVLKDERSKSLPRPPQKFTSVTKHLPEKMLVSSPIRVHQHQTPSLVITEHPLQSPTSVTSAASDSPSLMPAMSKLKITNADNEGSARTDSVVSNASTFNLEPKNKDDQRHLSLVASSVGGTTSQPSTPKGPVMGVSPAREPYPSPGTVIVLF